MLSLLYKLRMPDAAQRFPRYAEIRRYHMQGHPPENIRESGNELMVFLFRGIADIHQYPVLAGIEVIGFYLF